MVCSLALAPLGGRVSASSAKDMTAATAAVPAPALQCTLEMASLAPPTLRWTLRNTSAAPLAVLNWGTPLEGWMQPFVRVTREGVVLSYQGPAVKRGDPDRSEYVRVPSGRTRTATLALAPAFEVGAPGRYRIEPQITLHDVTTAAVPRPRSAHQSIALSCPTLEFEVR